MKLKFKNILLISLLAVAGIFSATVVAFNKQVNEQPAVEKAEAAENIRPPVYLRNNYNGSWVDTPATSNGNNEYKVLGIWVPNGGLAVAKDTYGLEYKTTAAINEYSVAGFSLSSNLLSYSGSGGFYDIYIQGANYWDSGYSGYAKYYVGASSGYTITRKISKDGSDQGADSLAHELLSSGATLTDPSVSYYGYKFDGWYTAVTGGTKRTTATKSETLYARFVSSSTKDYYLDATDGATSYFKNNPNFVWVHAWDASGNEQNYANASITKISETGTVASAVAYKITLPDNVSFMWVAGNSGVGDYDNQTATLTNTSGTNLYVLNGSNTEKVWNGSWASGKTVDGSTALVTLKYTYGGNTTTIGTYGKLVGTSFVLSDSLFTAPTTYSKNANWYDESNPSSTYSNGGSFYPQDDITLVNACNYIVYTIQYQYVVDGVLQDKTITKDGNNYNWGSLAKGTVYTSAGNQKFSDLADPTFYGCSFDGWYSNEACTSGLASTPITGNYSSGVYAKFTSNNTNNNYYLGIVGSTTNINADLIVGNKASWSNSAAYTYVWYWNEGHTVSTVVKLKEQQGISLTGWKFFLLRLPSTADNFLYCSGSWWDSNKYNQTINLDTSSGDTTIHANGNTLYAITDSSSSGSNGERKGKWVEAAYVLDVADNSSFNSNLNSYPMMVPTETAKDNVAQIMKITIATNKYVRGRYYFTVGSTLYESTAVTRGGDDGDPAYTQQTQVSSQNVGVKMLSEKTVNIYITSSRNLFFVDCEGVEAAGFIYISTQYTPSQINVTCTVTPSGSSPINSLNGDKLSSVTGVTYSTTLTYDDIKGMIMVPIYNLKGSAPSSTDTFAISLASASGTVSLTGVSVLAEGTAEYIVELDSGSTWSGSRAVSSSADPAIAAYDIDRAIASTSDKSVCSIDSTVAKRLCTEYDNVIKAGGAGKTSLEASTVSTWASTVGDSGDDILMPYIRYQLGNIAGGEYRTSPLSSFVNIFNLMGSESSFSTIIIVISSSVALLSVTALSILVIRKRKSKEIE